MKKYSHDARELLTDSELYEIKAGEASKGNGNEHSCTMCASTCVACATCVACTSTMADVLDVEAKQ